ncbi:MAG: metal-dependent DNase YabD [Parcubacteria group bacterium Gr01-1014_48]|nr:MAG: metal-dependent DNase YabD [Parcubacteria group bacterium Greene0416_14]TSC73781.1 MAG: metal-dependent DNase YabD [Parcubacteria group bacterium Gr01-1014_48]TSD00648.1 MAG: metal-dependent DNase YabD [Parcubacteria group bacterium Greene1014_15]TSD08084.1 MAG: metal-dependent DNase YabD [Parcubacteria group bacterium Greene0714_4]
MSIPQYFDVHTHAHFVAYDTDREEVLRRALDAHTWMVNVGTQKDTSCNAVEIAKKFGDGVYATVGLHPIHTEKSHHDAKELGADQKFTSRGEEFDIAYYTKLAQEDVVVAIGECGLDYYRLSEETKEKQYATLWGHIEVARAVSKPLMIHCRNAFDDLIPFLASERKNIFPENPGIIHFFTGTVAHARALLELGFSFSFGGVTTFTRDYDEAIRFIPLEYILSETDAPYVTPVPFRGKRNEPLYVKYVVEQIAKIRNEDFEKVRSVLVDNALRVFRLA